MRFSQKLLIGMTLFLGLLLVVSGCGSKNVQQSADKVEQGNSQQSEKAEAPSQQTNTLSAISIGTSSQGSSLYVLTVGIADLVSKEAGINASVESVGGSEANIRAINDGKIEFAAVNLLAPADAYTGKPPFDKAVDVRLIAVGNSSARQIVARASSGIKTPADLAGKKVIGRRKSLSDLEQLLDATLKAYGVDKSSVKVLETAETGEAIEALKVGTADAAILPGGVPTGPITELAQTTDVVFLDLNDKMPEILAQLSSAFHDTVIPKGSYKGQDKDVHVPSIDVGLVAAGDVPEETVYQVTKALMGNYDIFKQVHNTAKKWTVENTINYPPLPFHDGAIRYYKEIGAWNDEVQAKHDQMLTAK